MPVFCKKRKAVASERAGLDKAFLLAAARLVVSGHGMLLPVRQSQSFESSGATKVGGILVRQLDETRKPSERAFAMNDFSLGSFLTFTPIYK